MYCSRVWLRCSVVGNEFLCVEDDSIANDWSGKICSAEGLRELFLSKDWSEVGQIVIVDKLAI